MAVIFILFMPVVGCGGENYNGIELIQEKEVWKEVKACIVLSVVCGLVVLMLRAYMHMAIAALAGAISLLLSYVIAHSKNEGFELKIGAILALMSFMVSMVVSVMSNSRIKEAEDHPPQDGADRPST